MFARLTLDRDEVAADKEASAGRSESFDVQTLLRLPNGIFYANTVLANVLFFERKAASLDAPSTRDCGCRSGNGCVEA